VSCSIDVRGTDVFHSVDNMSNHSALFVDVEIPLSYVSAFKSDVCNLKSRLAWHRATENDIDQYRTRLDEMLNSINVPDFIHECSNVLCSDCGHTEYIDLYCNNIICAIEEASKLIPHIECKSKNNHVPGWKDIVSYNKKDAMFWHKYWISVGRPKHGCIYENMKKFRRDYHYSIRCVKRKDSQLRKVKLLNSLLHNKHDFFKDVKKFKNVKASCTKTLNGFHDKKDIAESFASEYKELYNSDIYESSDADKFRSMLSSIISDFPASESDTFITIEDVQDALKHIKNNKSDGVYTFMSDNFIKGTTTLNFHLSKLLSFCLCHGYVPQCLLLSTLIPIPKDRLDDLTSSNNYRGIALCVLCLKIFEYVILLRHNRSFTSSNHQFAYKKESSTSQCTWVAREIITYYNNSGSHVYACLLDCSKAFDKIKYDILFDKLLSKGLSPIIIRFLHHCYTNSTVRVRWEDTISDTFAVSNGVRQGAVLSPFLFNIYMDELISNIKDAGSGCWMGDEFYGILVYADDILLLSPSITGLQNMLNICSTFGAVNGLQFNCKKTCCIDFHGKDTCCKQDLPVLLNGVRLHWSDSVKHLGHILTCCLSFDKDLQYKKGKFVACCNNILTEFSFAHPIVKTQLLNIYGTSFYGCTLWDLYSKSASQLYVTWNIALRRLYNLPYKTHTRFLEHISDLRHVSVSLKLRFIKFCKTLAYSKNSLIQNVTDYAFANNMSKTGLNLSRILVEFDICSAESFHAFKDNVYNMIVKHHNKKATLIDEEMNFCMIIKEMTDCVQKIKDCGLPTEHVKYIIETLCTM
jgi:hypothetical protein